MYGKDYEITKISEGEEKIIIELISNKKEEKCPKCGEISNKLSGTYTRLIQDIPIRNQQTWLAVKVKQYYCDNKKCEAKVFSEKIPFAKVNQVKTDSLVQMILAISLYLSNTSCSLILGFLGIKVSADTIQNIYDNITIEDDIDVEEIGIDDVATRKGRKYATAIYNQKNHRLIALLEGRDAIVVKQWLKEHPNIKIAARDRASAYASAITEILPNCIQVADRFHLLQNLIDQLKDIFYKEIPKKIYLKDGEIIKNNYTEMIIKEIKDIDVSMFNYDNSPPLNEEGKIIYFDNKKRDISSLEYQKYEKARKKKYEKIKAIQAKYPKGPKYNYEEIANEFDISIPTARTYVKMDIEKVESVLKLNNYKKRKTIVDDYLNIIYKMLKDGLSHNEIFAYIISKGYDNDYKGLSNYIYFIAKNNFPNLKIKRTILYNKAYPKDVTIITNTELLRYALTIDKTRRSKKIIQIIEVIKKQYPIIEDIENCFKEFHEIIMGNDEKKLDEFIDKHKETRIKGFAKNLLKDIKAIKYAITKPISSGFVEGNNNKFKLIKRIVYGKMDLVNLFKKSYLLFWCTKDDFDIKYFI